MFTYKFGSYNNERLHIIIRKKNPLNKVGLGQKTGMLNYHTSMAKHFEGLHRKCTNILPTWLSQILRFFLKSRKTVKRAIERKSELHSWNRCNVAVGG